MEITPSSDADRSTDPLPDSGPGTPTSSTAGDLTTSGRLTSKESGEEAALPGAASASSGYGPVIPSSTTGSGRATPYGLGRGSDLYNETQEQADVLLLHSNNSTTTGAQKVSDLSLIHI